MNLIVFWQRPLRTSWKLAGTGAIAGLSAGCFVGEGGVAGRVLLSLGGSLAGAMVGAVITLMVIYRIWPLWTLRS